MNWYRSILKVAIPLPEIYGLPEDYDQREHSGIDRLKRFIPQEIADNLSKNYNMAYVGSGAYGIASNIGGDKVMKLTTDIGEYRAAKWLLENQDGINPRVSVRVYSAKYLAEDVYQIVMERIQPLDSNEGRIFDELRIIFNPNNLTSEQLKYPPIDIISNNLNIRRELVKEVSNKYLKLFNSINKARLSYYDIWGRNIGKDKNGNYLILDLGSLG